MSNTLRSRLFPDTEDWDTVRDSLSDEFLDILVRTPLTYFATTKSSAMRDADYTYHPSVRYAANKKCMERVLTFLKLNPELVSVLDFLEMLAEDVNSKEFLVVSMFRKPQNTGTREIFVLSLAPRIIIWTLERFATLLCKKTESEMISHGRQKLRRTKDHSMRVAQAKRSIGRTLQTRAHHITCSDDASKWCQMWLMTTLWRFIAPFAHADIAPLLTLSFNLISSKRLRMPKALLDLYSKGDVGAGQYPKNTDLIEADFRYGLNNNFYCETSSMLFKNRSNMMQGILNMVTSAAHASYLMVCEDVWKDRVTHTLESKLLEVTMMCSSDDSGAQLTYSYLPRDEMKARCLRLLLPMVKRVGYRYMSAVQSVQKSTEFSAQGYYEFNSAFFILSHEIGPVLKMAIASVKGKVSGSLLKRVRTAHEGLRNLAKSGAACNLCRAVSLLQGRKHYRYLGWGVDHRWKTYETVLSKGESVSCGYFPFQRGGTCGPLGYQAASHWNCTMSERFSRSLTLETMKDYGNSEVNPDGSRSASVKLTFGTQAKFRDFKDRNAINGEEVLKSINTNPGVLYKEDPSASEHLLLLSGKFLDSSLADMFSSEGEYQEIVASSYILSSPCWTTVSFASKRTLLPQDVQKMCEALAAEKIVTEEQRGHLEFAIKNGVESRPSREKLITFTTRHLGLMHSTRPRMDLISAVHPLSTFYNRLYSKIAAADLVSMEVPRGSRSEHHRTVSVSHHIEVDAYTIRKALNYWFRGEGVVDRTLCRLMVSRLQRACPWLQSTLPSTLKGSPFRDHLSLFRYLNSLASRRVSVELSGVLSRAETKRGTLVDYFLCNENSVTMKIPMQGVKSLSLSDSSCRERADTMSCLLWMHRKDSWSDLGSGIDAMGHACDVSKRILISEMDRTIRSIPRPLKKVIALNEIMFRKLDKKAMSASELSQMLSTGDVHFWWYKSQEMYLKVRWTQLGYERAVRLSRTREPKKLSWGPARRKGHGLSSGYEKEWAQGGYDTAGRPLPRGTPFEISTLSWVDSRHETLKKIWRGDGVLMFKAMSSITGRVTVRPIPDGDGDCYISSVEVSKVPDINMSKRLIPAIWAETEATASQSGQLGTERFQKDGFMTSSAYDTSSQISYTVNPGLVRFIVNTPLYIRATESEYQVIMNGTALMKYKPRIVKRQFGMIRDLTEKNPGNFVSKEFQSLTSLGPAHWSESHRRSFESTPWVMTMYKTVVLQYAKINRLAYMPEPEEDEIVPMSDSESDEDELKRGEERKMPLFTAKDFNIELSSLVKELSTVMALEHEELEVEESFIDMLTEDVPNYASDPLNTTYIFHLAYPRVAIICERLSRRLIILLQSPVIFPLEMQDEGSQFIARLFGLKVSSVAATDLESRSSKSLGKAKSRSASYEPPPGHVVWQDRVWSHGSLALSARQCASNREIERKVLGDDAAGQKRSSELQQLLALSKQMTKEDSRSTSKTKKKRKKSSFSRLEWGDPDVGLPSSSYKGPRKRLQSYLATKHLPVETQYFGHEDSDLRQREADEKADVEDSYAALRQRVKQQLIMSQVVEALPPPAQEEKESTLVAEAALERRLLVSKVESLGWCAEMIQNASNAILQSVIDGDAEDSESSDE
jgi:hypothetical protein